MFSPTLERTLHDAATWYMVGIIWLVQLVQYPMFEYLDRATFTRSHAFHTSVIGLVVGPGMLIELVLSALILWRRGPSDWPALGGFALVIMLWAVTFFVMIPLHNRLAIEGFQAEVHHALVNWNWLRTLAWTARGSIAAFWLWSSRT